MASRKPVQRPKRLFQRHREAPIPPGTQVIRNAAGKVKMSEVLEEFVEPYLETITDDTQYRQLLGVAIIAWNAALTPEDQRQKLINDLLAIAIPSASDAEWELAHQFVESLIERKLTHFAANRRMIFSFEISPRASGRNHLSVASSFDDIPD